MEANIIVIFWCNKSVTINNIMCCILSRRFLADKFMFIYPFQLANVEYTIKVKKTLDKSARP